MDNELHLALTFDSGFAMPAAVTIRSAVENTPGRVCIYVVDCGLSESDKGRLQQSIPPERDVTLTFLTLPSGSVAGSQGPAWGVIDLFSILLIDKVLYLDADTLVQGDLRELWATNLNGKPVAAARDLSFPLGHVAVGKGSPYFNSGVLILDLKKIRKMLVQEPIRPLAEAMQNHILMDQDPLNVYFRDNWEEISLKWNAHGLGTLAESFDSKDSQLDLKEMKENPQIVHFTGSVHPSMELVLYEWFPLTSKPWGYAGAPNHPFEKVWWETLERTAWAGVRDTREYQSLIEKKKNAAVEKGVADFYRKLAANSIQGRHAVSIEERFKTLLTSKNNIEVA